LIVAVVLSLLALLRVVKGSFFEFLGSLLLSLSGWCACVAGSLQRQQVALRGLDIASRGIARVEYGKR
jgi:hypothetical protein